MASVLKKFRQDVFAIIFLSAGLFLTLALATYEPKDPSLNSLGQGLKAVNACGLAGSFIADLLFQVFGVMSWAIVLVLLRCSWASFRGEEIELRHPKTLWISGLVLSVSSLLALYLPETRLYAGNILPGGIIGWGLNKALVQVFNGTGAQVVLWTTVLLLGVFLLERSLQDLMPNFAGKFSLSKSLSSARLWVAPLFQRSKKPKKSVALEPKITLKKETPVKSAVLLPENPPQMEFVDTEEDLEDETSASFGSEKVAEDADEEEAPEIPGARRRVVLKAKPPKKIENWKMPSISLLEDPPASRVKMDREELRRKAELLTEKLMKFRIEGTIVDAKPGPLVTMYEFKPNADVKISNISSLEDDLSLALSSESVRVMGQIPGTDVVGIETANSKRETVFYKDLLAEEKFWRDDVALPIALGKQGNGDPKIENLRAMPHLLIAGTTGSGKSVFMRSIISGLLFRHSPKTLRLLLIDPKMVDLADFRDVPHLILPHVTEPKKAVTALRWAVREMDKRYRSLSRFGAAKLEGFNERVGKLAKDEIAEHEKNNADAESSPASGETYYYQQLPYIVVIVDELADLMVIEKQNVEPSIQRLAQKARACGIHLIFATQTPRKEVVTGLIKSNFPGRVALKVSSPLDSRIILEETGAERLLPNGDMLFLAPGVNKPARHHGPYLSDDEIQNVVQFWSAQSAPEYDPVGMQMLEGPPAGQAEGLGGVFSEDDAGEEYDHIVRWTTEQKTVSASMLQRRFQIGYPKAARFIELMESSGLVSCANGSKPRQVLAGPLK